MKLSAIVSVFVFAAAAVAAVANGKKYIVSFPAGTSQGEVDKAIKELESQGAQITHRYRKSPVLHTLFLARPGG